MTGSSIIARIKAQGRGPVARASVLSLVLRIASLGIGFLQAVLTGRLLGPEGYGQVAVVFSLSLVLATLSMGGANVLSVKEVARLNALEAFDRLHGFLRMTLLIGTGFTLGFIALYLAVGMRFAPAGDLAIYVALLAPLLTLIHFGQSVMSGFGKVFMAQGPMLLLRPILQSSVLLAIWAAGLSIDPRAYIHIVIAAAGVAALAVGVAVIRKTALLRSTPPAKAQPRQWLHEAAPLYVTGIAVLALNEINTLMLGWWAGPQETGLFQPVARISLLLTMGLHTVSIRFGPRVAELYAQGEHARVEDISHKAAIAATAVAAAVTFGLILFAPFILGLFGQAFLQSASALWWVVAAQILTCATGLVIPLLNMSGHGRSALLPQITGVAVNIALGSLLIPTHGAVGAAMSMLGAMIVVNLMMLLAVRRHLGFSPDLISALRAGGTKRG
ncbi:oligosaccharide flippase family protein [Roseovarius sp. PS-C2]|uniref:lipopolysaccharide biosynthesis protein n=1 Tax=Roseovarius sp. PS-C2 TaxID=2820814 RepID=UPI001C0D66C3|nr:oligosaccharide flippase family protein [Roseovarius sp. PS-C2]